VPPYARLSKNPDQFRSVLRAERGNITRAAIALGISKTYAMRLVKKFKLREWARELREESGAPAVGRPR
jgi:hypothetical protein